MNYTYTVERIEYEVFYTILRDDVPVTTREVTWNDLNFFKAIFMFNSGNEYSIAAQLKKAHVLAQFGLDALEKYEVK